MRETHLTTTGPSRLFGLEIDRLTMSEALGRCVELVESGGFAQHVAINAAKVVMIHDDPDLRAIVQNCEIVTADGQAIVWASKILGDPLPARVAGIDLMEGLFARAEGKGYRVFILGARRHVLERAVERLRESHPRLNIVGYRDGYFSDQDAAGVADEIRNAAPDILFVAISSPRKEYWLGRYGSGLGVPFVMGVGGAVDILAGVTRRAPRTLQEVGLEWAYRLAQEPRRLLWRYTVTNWRFLLLLIREARLRHR